MKGIYTGIAAMLSLAAFTAQAAQGSSASASASDQNLQQELSKYAQTHPSLDESKDKSIADAMAKLGQAAGNNSLLATTKGCVDATSTEIDTRYVMTFDAANQPCRIYDLSFPTVASLFGIQTVSKIPVQKFTSDDYLNWMHGNYDQVYKGIQNFQSAFKSGQTPAASQANWMKDVELNQSAAARLLWSEGTSPTGLPNQFKASDLKIGSNFAFSNSERQQLRDILAQSSLTPGFATGNDAWAKMVENPIGILEHIRFVWNDAEKAFDVIMDGDFFPIVGPVALVDFGQPYKPAVQAMVRGLVQKAIMRLVNGVGSITNQRILTVALNDGFEFIEDIYSYQQNMMEMSLHNMQIQAGDGTDLANNSSRGIDLLFATRTGFFTDYITATAQGQKFDWSKLELKGHQARYKAEKAREISMDKRNSELALKGGCTTTPMADYFAVCTKNGKAAGVYSLLSETSVLFWSLGAPMVFNPNMPSEVLLKRATSRILETGLRIVRLPILNFLTDMLADNLKAYAMAGADDEAFLHSNLLMVKHTHGGLDSDSASMLKWMYLQNINPFMPKTELSENSTVQTNRGQASH